MEVSVEPKLAVNGVVYPFHCHETGRDGPGRLAGAHLHNYIELLYCTQGCAELLIGESVCRFTPGDLALINSHEVHSVEAIDPVRTHYLVLKFEPELLFSAEQSVFELRYMLPFVLRQTPYEKVISARALEGSGIPASEELNAMLERKGTAPVANSARLADLLRRPQVSYADIAPFDPERPELSLAVTDEVEIQIKYAGYLTRQEKQVEEFRKEEARLLPENLDYAAIPGLRLEAREKLAAIRPVSIGQAGRISGVSPADIAVLLIYLEQTNG